MWRDDRRVTDTGWCPDRETARDLGCKLLDARQLRVRFSGGERWTAVRSRIADKARLPATKDSDRQFTWVERREPDEAPPERVGQ